MLSRSRISAVIHRNTEVLHGRVVRPTVAVIGSIRRECLDHVIVMKPAGLHLVITEYVAYYMRSRTHLALGKDTPLTRPVSPPSGGRIVTTPEVGGLHHRYDRIAA
jgi:putative transposase